MELGIVRSISVVRTGDRQFDCATVHGAIVVKDAKNALIGCLAGMCELFDEVRIVYFLCPLGDDPQKTAIDENSNFENWHGKIISPREGAVYCSPTSVADMCTYYSPRCDIAIDSEDRLGRYSSGGRQVRE